MSRKCKGNAGGGGSGESGTGRWMLTYLDMVTLLFGVFIIMYAMSENNPAKMAAVSESLRFAFMEGGMGIMGGGHMISPRPGAREDIEGYARDAAYLRATEILKAQIGRGDVRVSQDERGVVITLAGLDYFAPGSATLTPQMERVLSRVALLLDSLDRYVRIEGHSDPGTDGTTAANLTTTETHGEWSLAARRAVNVLEFLIYNSKINPEQLSAVSYGSRRPLDKSGTPEASAVNRRIEIVIVKDVKYKPGTSSPELMTEPARPEPQ